uniref:Transmembrane protein 115 n=1 Tax=Rhabditophanes sp. KR3021 TaxID=114890 RepID=A0AC35U6C2_9BILA
MWKYPFSIIIEPNILILIFTLVSFYHAFHLIEPAWGKYELVKFSIGIHIITTIMVSVTVFILYVLTRDLDLYFNKIINGLVPASAAFYVAIKQFLPDVAIFTTPFGRIKNTHLPFCCASFTLILALIGIVRPMCILQVFFATQISWTYLRFYQVGSDDTHLIGDQSDHFAWITLFPRVLQPIAAPVANTFFKVMQALNIIKPINYVDVNSMNPVPLSAFAALDMSGEQEKRDSDRRRQRALQDLKARLSKSKQVEPSQEHSFSNDVPLESVQVIIDNDPKSS